MTGVQQHRQDRERYELNPVLAYAQRKILEIYGKRVSYLRDNLSSQISGYGVVTTTLGQVWGGPGLELRLEDNLIDHIVSSDAADNQVIAITGHRIDNGELFRVSQNAVLNGQTPVPLSQPMARVDGTLTNGNTPHAGTVYVMVGTDVTGGVPNVASDIHCSQTAFDQNSQKSAISTSWDEFAVIPDAQASCFAEQGQQRDFTADFIFRLKTPNTPERTIYRITAAVQGGTVRVNLESPLIVPPNSDLRILVNASQLPITVGGSFSAMFARVYS